MLKLGDTRERALELFPLKPDVDQESQEPNCGTELNWVDLENPKSGNLFIHLRGNLVFQIDVATTRYQTAEGITSASLPQDVRRRYKGLRSFLLSENTSEAFGNRPLVYWVDRQKGIAFAFAYSKTEHLHYLWGVIVFKPNSEICPMDDSVSSPAKRELAPYSLEPSDTKD